MTPSQWAYLVAWVIWPLVLLAKVYPRIAQQNFTYRLFALSVIGVSYSANILYTLQYEMYLATPGFVLYMILMMRLILFVTSVKDEHPHTE
jgi:hypothetical protein